MVVLLVALAAALVGPGVGAAGEAVAPACRPHTDCKLVSVAPREFFFDVEGVPLIIMFIEEKHLKVWCDSDMFTASPPAADAAALPALPAAAAVDHVVLSGCRLPASFAGALAALNVTAAQILEIIINENDTLLQRHHFADLNVPSLIIRGVGSPTDDDFLSDVTGLRKLQLHNLLLSEKARENLPVTLTKLFLHDALVIPVGSLRWLERLRSLSILNIFQEGEDAPLTPPLMGQFRNLTDVELQVPLQIPPLWLNGSALRSLRLHACGLRGLRADTFAGVNLTALSITKDDLSEAPAGLISKLRWLRALDVSQSRLGGAALRRLVGPLARLRELRANHNPLGSLCPGARSGVFFKAPSGLPASLRRLHLRGTNASALCSDWVDVDHELEYIDLSLNNIDTLEYDSLRMMRTPQKAREVQLVLTENPLGDVLVRAGDQAACRAARRAPSPLEISRVPVRVSLSALHCDCRNARLRALAARCPLLQLEPAPCRAPPRAAPRTSLRAPPADFLDYLPEELLCECPADYNFSVPGCTCGKRIQDNATVVECAGTGAGRGARWPRSDRAEPLALAAAGAGLRAVPAATLVELHAANNSITTLAEEDISDTLLVLDLRNNSIEHISVETVRRLGSAGPGGRARRVWLGGNPLACSCADRAAVEALKSVRVQAQLQDWKELRCRDGRELATLVPSELCLNPLVPAVAVPAALLLLLALAAPFALRWARPRLKQFLFDRQLFLGWVLRANDAPDDPTKTHDVFISYAYPDRRLAMKLRQWLDDQGFSTVEHSRDWLAGVPVDEHIANSVTCARRTLLLVSDSFAASVWGLQEFHAAHAHALEKGSARIIPVRCHLSEMDALPPDLRLYLYNNTYLSYDDPEFWNKLLRVLPPRAPAPPAPPPPRGKEPPLAAQFVPAHDAPAAC